MELLFLAISLFFTFAFLAIRIISIIISYLFVFFFGFTIAMLYCIHFYFSGAENTRESYAPIFRSWVQWLLATFAKNYHRYEIHYQSQKHKEEVHRCLNPLNKEEVAIFAASPHGLVASATFYNAIAPYEREWEDVILCVHSHLFAWPVVRELALALGVISVVKENIIRQLQVERRSIYVVLGGCREMIIDQYNEIQDRHKGLLKIAYEKQIPIYPILHKGQESVFPTYSRPWLDKVRHIVLDLIGYPFPCFTFGPYPGKLDSYVLEAFDPRKYENEESFIREYYTFIIKEYKEISKGDLLKPIETMKSENDMPLDSKDDNKCCIYYPLHKHVHYHHHMRCIENGHHRPHHVVSHHKENQSSL